MLWFLDDIDNMSLAEVGPVFLNIMNLFPERVNTEFVQLIDSETIKCAYGRGGGETLACGTGACAACRCSGIKWILR